jgi:hypothetical protein
MSQSDIFSIIGVTKILKIIDQCDIKHIMTLQIDQCDVKHKMTLQIDQCDVKHIMTLHIKTIMSVKKDCISGVMVIVHALSVVHRGSSPGRIKPKSIKLVFVAPPLFMQY